jgi:hypothetical protein
LFLFLSLFITSDFFDWIKGAELIELESCDTTEDPVRPELDVSYRRSHGRKIFGVKYKKEICAIMCFGFTDEVPTSVKELDLMTRDAHLKSAHRDQNIGKLAIAYTIWSKKKGGGKLIVKEIFKMIKKSNHLDRLITLSPLTDMARNFHPHRPCNVHPSSSPVTFVRVSPETICETNIRTSGNVPDMEDHVSLDANHWRLLVL